jgi:SAM-dependent methyltransferase
MAGSEGMDEDRDREHWQGVHSTRQIDGVSWWQQPEDLWLDLITELPLGPDDPIVDIGAGSSPLSLELRRRGFHDVTAVDISPAALERIRADDGTGPAIRLVVADARRFAPERPVAVWHDRAVFHFLTDEADRDRYRGAMRAALRPGGFAVVSTFAADGPETCSGLPVARYDTEGLVAALGFAEAGVFRTERRVHRTPWGSEQPFTIVVVRA